MVRVPGTVCEEDSFKARLFGKKSVGHPSLFQRLSEDERSQTQASKEPGRSTYGGKEGLRYTSAAGGWRCGGTRFPASAQTGPGSLAPEGKNPLLVVVHLGPRLPSVLISREEPGTQVFTQCVSIFNFGNYFRFFQELFHRPNILRPRASGSLGLLVLDVTGDISRLQQS